jgi:hypothetical protein
MFNPGKTTRRINPQQHPGQPGGLGVLGVAMEAVEHYMKKSQGAGPLP